MGAQAQTTFDKRRFRAVRSSTVICMVVIWLPFVICFVRGHPMGSYLEEIIVGTMLTLPFVGPYALIPYYLKRKQPKDALARAAGMGTAGFIVASVLVWGQLRNPIAPRLGWGVGLVFLIVIWGAQLALVIVGAKTYFALGLGRPDAKVLEGVAGSGGIFLLLWLVLLGGSWPVPFYIP